MKSASKTWGKFLLGTFGLVFWIHLFLITLAYLSPFLFDWKWIALGIFILFAQYAILEGCYLTHFQFGKEDKNTTFYSFYFELLGLDFDRKKLKIFVRYFVPFIILSLALVWQLLLDKQPLLF